MLIESKCVFQGLALCDPLMVDDGQGLKQVFRVENFDLVSIPPEDFGKFYSGDCYVILYTYVVNKKEKHIIYFWLVITNISH